MGKSMRLLIIEDSENDALLLLRELRKGGYQPEYKRVDTEIAMIEALEKDKWDIIISDYSMPQFNGIAALKISQKYKPDLPFIIVSGTIGEDVAVEAMKAGAHDYLMKGNLERLTPAIERELHDARIRREHKLSLIKLRQTEWIVESSHDMMALLNKDFVYLYANDAYLKAFGKTRDQLLGQSVPDVFGEVVFKTTIKPHADRCFEGKKARYQEWFDFPTLGHRYLDVAYTQYIGETNVVNEFVVIARDITEFKQTQEALLESEKRLIKAQHIAKMGDFTWDVETGEVTWSDELFDLLQYDKSEKIDYATVNEQIHHPDDLKRVTQWLKDCIASGKGGLAPNEYRLIRKDGKILYVNTVGVIERQEGKSTKVFATLQDVTERKQAEEALRESEEKFRVLFDLSPHAIALTEIKTGKFIDVNDKFYQLTKYTKDELIGRTTTQLGFYSEDDRNKFINELTNAGKVDGLEMDFKVKDGSIINARMFAIPIQIGMQVFLLTEFYDITSQKRLEAQLQQAQKMESVGTLAGGVAHDFNNLLMAIQGRTSIVLMSKDSSHPDFDHLKGIEGHIKSAADLTRQLLGFARGGKYEVWPTDLNELIEKQNRMFGRTKKEININGKYEENIWFVEIDRGQIEQVLLNLYVNAWQAMPEGGDLYLATENVTLDKSYVKPFSIEHGRYVKISVTDTGVGMDKATQKKIFDPFFTTKEMGRGTGLGLASSYGIIKNHGGFINVYSEKGHGTTFNIYLPSSEKEVSEDKKPSGDLLKGSETVLFVDDEDMIIEVAEVLLKELGYKVLIARGGKEAVEIYEKNKDLVDIVILDMIMPNMSGSVTYDRLKEIDPDIKVLLSSGYSINGQATEIMDRGCNGFIQKPFKLKELSQKLREVLDKK